MSNKNTVVGSKIKGIRESKSLSVEEIAERSGLSVEQVNSIENDENLPSLGPLIKIARALGVRLGTFLDDSDALGPVVCRAEEHNNSISFSNDASDARKNMEYFSLAKEKAGRHMEPCIIDIQPSEEKDFKLSAHEEELTTGGDIYFKLSLNANSDPESVGFYYGAEGGAAFTNGAHKAYLALPAEQAAGTNYVWYDVTGISGVKAVENNSKDAYTVTGIRVNKSSDMPKGIYIVGGKKVVVK